MAAPGCVGPGGLCNTARNGRVVHKLYQRRRPAFGGRRKHERLQVDRMICGSGPRQISISWTGATGRFPASLRHVARHAARTRNTGDRHTMTVYMIADIKVTNDEWVAPYAASVHELVHKHGGKYLARSGNVQTLEGKPLDTTLIALLAFPSAQAVRAFLSDPK